MQFTIKFPINNTSVTSQDVIESPSDYRQSFIDLYNLSCTIQLHSPSITWEIEDELPVLIANFFLRSTNLLSSERSATYIFFEYTGQVQLVLIEDNICISGDFVEDFVIEFNLFKELSAELGKHTIEFLEKLNSNKFESDLNFIRQALADH